MALADRQTLTRIAANVEAKMVSWVAAMLTDTISAPKDGPKITADNDAVGKSPVNPGMWDLGNMLTGLAGAVFGNIPGVTQRTLKSVYLDGTGGVTHALSGGYAQALTGVLVGAFGAIRASLSNKELNFTGTAASGSNPVGTVAAPNTLNALLMTKAWIRFQTNGVGGITYQDGGCVASVTLPGASQVRVNLATPFDNVTWGMVPFVFDAVTGSMLVPTVVTMALDHLILSFGVDPAATAIVGMVVFFGRQTT